VKVLLVTYQLVPVRPVVSLITELQNSPHWWHFFDYTWLIGTNETADELYGRVSRHLTAADRELIVELRRGVEYQGWLTKEAWDWINERLALPNYYPYR